MAGGVEHQQLRAVLGQISGLLQPFCQLLGGSPVGSRQVRPQIIGLDLEVGQVSRPLHQGAAHKGTARQVGGQCQLGGGGLGVQVRGPVHDQPGSTARQQLRLPAHPGQHPDILQVHSLRPQRQGEEEPLAL